MKFEENMVILHPEIKSTFYWTNYDQITSNPESEDCPCNLLQLSTGEMYITLIIYHIVDMPGITLLHVMRG